MRMSVVNVRKMCMLVFEFCMLVVMCVRLNAIPFKVMDMLVVLVMFMFVFMLQRFMQMFMCMVLGQMKPNNTVTTVLLQSPKWTTETWKQWLEKIQAPFMESNFSKNQFEPRA